MTRYPRVFWKYAENFRLFNVGKVLVEPPFPTKIYRVSCGVMIDVFCTRDHIWNFLDFPALFEAAQHAHSCFFSICWKTWREERSKMKEFMTLVSYFQSYKTNVTLTKNLRKDFITFVSILLPRFISNAKIFSTTSQLFLLVVRAFTESFKWPNTTEQVRKMNTKNFHKLNFMSFFLLVNINVTFKMFLLICIFLAPTSRFYEDSKTYVCSGPIFDTRSSY